jgi:molybdate transport system regulatory protein
VKSIRADGITAEVVLDVGHGMEIVSVITSDSVERLGLKVGEPATAVIKSTEVMIGK